jgi:hypothetical protein
MKRIAVSAGVLVALAVVAALAVGGAGAANQADDAENDTALGAEISSFMQASSAEAEGEVDDGMFNAALNRTEDPDERRQLIEQRQQRLEQRQQKLEDRRARISTEDGADVEDRALATRVNVGAANLERSVNGTERAAQAAGLDLEALNAIRSSARDLRGPEVAAIASTINGSPAADRHGPPVDLPGNDDGGPDVVSNRSDARGNPDDVGASGERGNGSDGRPGERGDSDRGNTDGNG